jgi:hypothetical protein
MLPWSEERPIGGRERSVDGANQRAFRIKIKSRLDPPPLLLWRLIVV